MVISYRFLYHFSGGHEGVYPDIPEALDVADARWNSLVWIVDYLQRHGKRVTLVMQSPELPRHVKYIALRALESDGSGYGVDLDWWLRRSEAFRERVSSLPSSVIVLDPRELFCDQSRCRAVELHQALYFDDDHVSVFGARKIAREVYRLMEDNSSE